MLSAHVKLCSVLHLWLPPSLTHPISISVVFPSALRPSISVSLRPAAFPSPASYLLFSRLSGLSISPHLPPPLCLSRLHSLTPLISLSPLPAVSTSYSRLSSPCTYLPPLFLSNCLHLHTLLVKSLIPYAAYRNGFLCLVFSVLKSPSSYISSYYCLYVILIFA